jgi:hypothetical protein
MHMPNTPVEEFDDGIEQLLKDSKNSTQLEIALSAQPRQIWRVAGALEEMRDSQYSTYQVEQLLGLLETGSIADVDPVLLKMLSINRQARRLYELYAQIHNIALTQDSVGLIWMAWAAHRGEEYDTITGQTPVASLDEQAKKDVEDDEIEVKQEAPLCMTCGTKMKPAGSCYVCEGCGSTSGVK